MKYELNTPYDFEVRKVTEDGSLLFFEVEIGGDLFPVRAYPEQLEGSVPSVVSCRIVLDKDKNAYLVQNEAFFYPAVYKPSHRYLFEVVAIKDTYVVLQDKYGLYHTMPKDTSKFSLNEIIVRCVEVVNDNNCKAHLNFYYTEPSTKKEELVLEEKTDNIIQTNPVAHNYQPTIFVQDSPLIDKSQPAELSKPVLSNEPEPLANLAQETQQQSEPKESVSPSEPEGAVAGIDNKLPDNASVSSLIESRDWDNLRRYLDLYMKKTMIQPIQKEVMLTIEGFSKSSIYWETIHFFISYDAHMFLASLAKTNTSNIPDISVIDPAILDDIVQSAFQQSDKIKHALDLFKPCKDCLTDKQKDYIQTKSVGINTPEGFYSLFKLLKLSPDMAISFLLPLKGNMAAAYTLYKFYVDGLSANFINERSRFKSFRPSIIMNYCREMDKTKSNAFKVAANLIRNNILNQGSSPQNLLSAIAKDGFDGFKKYVTRKEQRTSTKNILSSLSKGDIIKELRFHREIDYYYILIEPQTNAFVLLAKDLTLKKPNKDIKSQGEIIDVKTNRGKTVFFIAQKSFPSIFVLPPLLKLSTILEIAFSEGIDGKWYPEVKNNFKLINVELDTKGLFINYKLRYKAQIVRRKDFFTYVVHLIR